MFDGLEILGRAKRQSRAEISRIIVIPANEQQPVICLREALTASFVEILVIAWFLESKTTITSNDDHGIRYAVLYAAFIDQLCEVTMDVATHHNALCIGEVKHVLYLLIVHLSLLPNL